MSQLQKATFAMLSRVATTDDESACKRPPALLHVQGRTVIISDFVVSSRSARHLSNGPGGHFLSYATIVTTLVIQIKTLLL